MGCFLFAVFCLKKPHVLFSPSCSFYPAFFLIMVCVRVLLSRGLFCRSPLLSAFMRKKVPVYAQRRGCFCARVWRSLRKASGVCAQALASCGAILAGAAGCLQPRVAATAVSCGAVLACAGRGGCALARFSARRVAAPCGERRGIAPCRAGLSVRPVPFLRKKCGGITGVFP